VLYVEPDSPAARDADEIARRYVDALAIVAEALGLEEDALPTIHLYITSRPGDAPRPPTTSECTEAAHAPGLRCEVAIWSAYREELPATQPEIDLTRALLDYQYGFQSDFTRFWDDGLAVATATRSRRSDPSLDPIGQCRQLLRDHGLPPVAELVVGATSHTSGLASPVSGAFATFLIDRYGLPRYRDLLRATHQGQPDSFEQSFPVTLIVAERDWRRDLEAADDESRASLWATARRLIPIASPHWRSGLVVLACSLVGVGFSLALPLSFRFLIDNILGRRPLAQGMPFIGPQGHTISPGEEQIHALVLLAGLLGLLYVANAASRLGMNLLLAVVGESFAFDLRHRLVSVLDRLPASYYSRFSPVDMSQRIVNDVDAIQGVLTRAVVPLFSGGVSLICFAILLVTLEPKLALLVLAGLPIVAAIHAARRRGRQSAARERARRISDLASRVTEAASGHITSKLFLAGPYLAERLMRRMEVHKQLNREFARESTLLAQVGTLVLGLIQVTVLMAGAYMIIVSDGRDLAPGSLVAFYIILNQMLGPIGQISTATQSVAGASANVERAAAVLEAPVETDPEHAVEVGPLKQAIRFENVSFGYPDGKPILKGLSLTIQAGTTAAFVGPSGAGKSSILQLLPRLYEPTRGTITWDGVDLSDAALTSLRRQIGLVPQDVALLNATVSENIRLGDDTCSDEDVWLAAHLAAADEEIAGLPQGYDTVVGGGSFKLSAGQRQRIAVARAMLRKPSLLILDEATSALDATRQRTIQERIQQHVDGQTVIKVAHRLETVVDADQIFVLDDGRLVEQGTHAELLAHKGLYARLFADQTAPLRRAREAAARAAN
jgi:ABC-type multidrug transport system fused ATPase/permease subunit